MQAASATNSPKTRSREVLLLQVVTLAWMLVECSAALLAAYRAHLVSMLAFGADSFIELLSAAVVLLQFWPGDRLSSERATRFCGWLLYVLAAAVTLIAVLGFFLGNEPGTSRIGMGITACALLVMPVLSRLKRNAADRLGSGALRADAVQSATCAYLAAITLLGQLLHTALPFRLLDPLAALAAVPILLVEARRARQGQVCGCC